MTQVAEQATQKSSTQQPTKAQRIIVDPVNRIEGHLRIEVGLDSNNVINNAVSCGTIFRGIELIVKDRDPRSAWAYAERICGVCTGVHAYASIQAVENALGIDIPDNANSIRNIMSLMLWAHDHLVHFYQLGGLDWIDVVSATKADPHATSRLAQKHSAWPNTSPALFASIQDKLITLATSGQMGIFKNGYWGNPGFKLSPEANLMLVTHYIEALDFQKDLVRIHTVFGGKNPHPNWLVGGVPVALNVDGKGGADTINMERLSLVKQLIDRTISFTKEVLLPDSILLAKEYPEWLQYGAGLSHTNILAYGAFPDIANDLSQKSLLIPGGAIVDGKFNEVHPVSLTDPEQIKEEVVSSWYVYPNGEKALHPSVGETIPHFSIGKNTIGSKTNIKQLDEHAPYSWVKTPTWRGHSMEVGPLARIIIGYYLNHDSSQTMVEAMCGPLGIKPLNLCSTMGRILCRAHEAHWAANTMNYFYQRLINTLKNGQSAVVNTEKWEPSSWPKEASGVGFTEAPRGALGHWISIKDQKISHYQAVVPTTWNAAPRNLRGDLGPYEASLLNTPVAVPNQPLEILRTIHSFDPCMACSTHILGADGSEQIKVTLE